MSSGEMPREDGMGDTGSAAEEDADSAQLELLVGSANSSAGSAPGTMSIDGAAEHASGPHPWDGTRALSNMQLAALNSFMIGWSSLWTCLLVITLPKQVVEMVGEDKKGSSLAAIVVVGGMVSLVAPPIIGYTSDRTFTRFGRRRPFIAVGTILCALFILLLPSCDTLGALCTVWFFVQLSSNLASNTFFALLPDVVPPGQRGVASGLMGAFSCLGQFLGAGVGVTVDDIGFTNAYLILMVLHILTSLPTVFMVKDANPARPPPASPEGNRCRVLLAGIAAPFLASSDYGWVYVTRLLMNMGQYTVQEFLEYYLRDIMAPYLPGGLSPTRAVSLLLMPLLFAALVAAYWGGRKSDAMGGQRKVFVYVSGLAMAGACLITIVNRSFFIMVALTIVFGAAFGLFGAVDFALICDVLPDKENSAKDMSIWHTALILPQMLATPIAGGVLDSLRDSDGDAVGYGVVYGIATVYFLVGAALVSRVRAVR